MFENLPPVVQGYLVCALIAVGITTLAIVGWVIDKPLERLIHKLEKVENSLKRDDSKP